MSTYDIDFIVQRFEANIYLVGGDVETYLKVNHYYLAKCMSRAMFFLFLFYNL